MGVKMMDEKKKPQKPMRRFRPMIPANKDNARYSNAISGVIRI